MSPGAAPVSYTHLPAVRPTAYIRSRSTKSGSKSPKSSALSAKRPVFSMLLLTIKITGQPWTPAWKYLSQGRLHFLANRKCSRNMGILGGEGGWGASRKPLRTLAGWTWPRFQVSRMAEMICKDGQTWLQAIKRVGRTTEKEPAPSAPFWAGSRRASILPPMSQNRDMGHPFSCWSALSHPPDSLFSRSIFTTPSETGTHISKVPNTTGDPPALPGRQ